MGSAAWQGPLRTHASGPVPRASCSAPSLGLRLPQWGLKPDPCLAASSMLVLKALCLARPGSPDHRGARALHCQSAKGKYPNLVAQTLPI